MTGAPPVPGRSPSPAGREPATSVEGANEMPPVAIEVMPQSPRTNRECKGEGRQTARRGRRSGPGRRGGSVQEAHVPLPQTGGGEGCKFAALRGRLKRALAGRDPGPYLAGVLPD